ncbi:MAG: hypothetical protein U1F56_06490 [Rubrivivax sp.]
MAQHPKAAPAGGLRPFGVPLLLVDSITEAPSQAPGQVVVSGSHAGASVVRYAVAAQARLAVFNDAGIGRDEAGVVALAALQAQGVAACAVSHDSARIGEAQSTFEDGVISRANAAAAALGAQPGLRLCDWLSAASAGSSPGRR